MFKRIALPLLAVKFVLALLIFNFATAQADGIIVPEPPICEDCGPVPLTGALDIRYHDVEVTITDQIAVTRVDQVFHNPHDFTVEGTYIFPLPKDAVVTNFKLWIDGQPVEGQVLDAGEARAIYEEIVRQMIDPAILEYVGQGAVRASIFPIAPDGDRRIELEYTQALTADNGLVKYTYPLNTEKFSRIPLERVSLSLNVQDNTPIRAFYSPSHDIGMSRESQTHVIGGYEAYDTTPDTDFTLYYSLGETEALHLVSYRDPGDSGNPDGYYLLMIAPRPDADQAAVAKDVLIVLDKSGSMDGEKYVQAQQAVRFILENLNEEDGFNIIQFSTGVELFSPELLPASEAAEGIRWIEADRPLGSTDINRALLEAAALVQSERPTYIIFLTDGLPTQGEVQSERILANFEANAPENVRMFSFGVGYDVDTFLLDLLAKEHNGTSSYVVPGERIDETVSAFYQKISAPVMTDLELEIDGVTVYDDYPNPLPDLFVGSQIIVTGRYKDGGSARITLSGEVNGVSQSFTLPEAVFDTDSRDAVDNSSYISRIWATRKIGYLLNQIRLNGPDEETVDQVVRLSIRYGIVTPYTSYLVTEDMPLGESAIDDLAQEEFESQAAEPAPAVSGEEAVERAADEGGLQQADSASAPEGEAAEIIRIVGSRTFVFTDNTWIDTTYDPEMSTVEVPFLSDDYFELVAAYPELADAFALGIHVIALADGTAYEVVGTDVEAPPIDVPEQREEETPEAPPPIETTPEPGETGRPETAATSEPAGTTAAPPCGAAFLPLLLVPLAVWRRKTR